MAALGDTHTHNRHTQQTKCHTHLNSTPTVRSDISFADRVKEKPFHLNDDEVSEAILKAVKDYWKHIIESWEVWGCEADGCSEEFGVENWIHCDAWSGRSWEYEEARRKGLPKDKKFLMENGIEFLGKVYYLDPDMESLDWEETDS